MIISNRRARRAVEDNAPRGLRAASEAGGGIRRNGIERGLERGGNPDAEGSVIIALDQLVALDLKCQCPIVPPLQHWTVLRGCRERGVSALPEGRGP